MATARLVADPMSLVADLVPGDVVRLGDDSATFVARTIHPLWSHLELVVWRMADGSWSHDALYISQYVGEVQAADVFARKAQLERALLGGGK